jgi:hypothetical protein
MTIQLAPDVSAVPLASHRHHPVGMIENSPAFQRWDCGQRVSSPGGTVDKDYLSRPSGTYPPGHTYPALKRWAILLCPSGTSGGPRFPLATVFQALVALAALWALPLSAQDLRIGEHAVLPGGLVNVPVVVSNAGGLASASLTINYDPVILSVEGVTNGGLGQPFALEYGTSEGQVRVAAVRDSALAGGSGALVVLSFRANSGSVPGLASPVAIADRRLGGEYGRDFEWSGAVSQGNGSVQVVSATDDQNANGLPDWWEEFYFGGPTAAAPAADDDSDGMTNAAEFVAGTDPLDPNSRLAVTALQVGPGGFSMSFPTVVGKVYAVEYSDTLAAWSVLASGIEGTGGVIEFNDSSTSAQRFYRLRVSD